MIHKRWSLAICTRMRQTGCANDDVVYRSPSTPPPPNCLALNRRMTNSHCLNPTLSFEERDLLSLHSYNLNYLPNLLLPIIPGRNG